MHIAAVITVQAYQLRKGGTPARMAILRMIASASKDNRNESTRLSAGDWKGARSTTLKGFESYFGLLSQGRNGTDSVWCAHKDPEFRDERNADDICPRLPRGWFTDSKGRGTARGIVARLTHGRFIAGYLWSDNGERVYFPDVFDDETEAARRADSHAESFAESAREDSERFHYQLAGPFRHHIGVSAMTNPLHSLVATYRARIDDALTVDELLDLCTEIIGEGETETNPDTLRDILTGYVDLMASNYGA